MDWDPGGILTPSTSWPKATAKVDPDSGPTFRLVALGFRAIQQSKDVDDAHDGHGDEVYLSAIVNRTKLTGMPIPVTKTANISMLMTRPHGDQSVPIAGRIKAGTASSTGGIKSGDVVPAKLNPAAATGALQQQTFPFLLWEGKLGDSDVVIVHPTLWEDDLNPVAHAAWLTGVIGFAASGYVKEPTLYAAPQDLLVYGDPHDTNTTGRQIDRLNRLANSTSASITSISNALTMLAGRKELQASPMLMCPQNSAAMIPLWTGACGLNGSDRPIGLEAWLGGAAARPYPFIDRVVVITKANVAAALSGTPYTPYAAWPRGTFSIMLNDRVPSDYTDIDVMANYEVFFRIEKVVP